VLVSFDFFFFFFANGLTPLWDRSAFSYPTVQKSGADAVLAMVKERKEITLPRCILSPAPRDSYRQTCIYDPPPVLSIDTFAARWWRVCAQLRELDQVHIVPTCDHTDRWWRARMLEELPWSHRVLIDTATTTASNSDFCVFRALGLRFFKRGLTRRT